MRQIQLSPHNLFLLVWLFPLLAPYLVESTVILHISERTKYLIYFNILFFYIIAICFYFLGFKNKSENIKKSIKNFNFELLERRFYNLFKAWLIIYLINIIGSGGVPIIWILINDPRTYVDFGLPSLGGLGNIFRAFLLSLCYIFIFHSNFNKEKKHKYKLIGLLLISSAFILETSRGNGVVLLLHPIGLYFLINEISFIKAIKWFIFLVFFLFLLGFIQSIRYTEGIESLRNQAANAGFETTNNFFIFLIPTITYIATPVVNTDLTIKTVPDLKFSPYYSLQSLIPTVIRDNIFEKGDYGELINEANNVSSFYVPFLRDYGYFGAGVIIALIQLISAWWYYKARTGHMFYILSWPPFFMSIALSFFSLFFTSLVVIFYPLLASLMLRNINKRKNFKPQALNINRSANV